MTKKEMQETIESRCVQAWDSMMWCSKQYGKHDNKTGIARARWIELNSLYKDLFNEEPRYH